MSYNLPEDIITRLREKFPNTDVNKFINFLFEIILEKTISAGSTPVREFGRFIAYKVFSNKKKCERVRFKFRITNSLQRKLSSDPFILNQLTLEDMNKFDEKNEASCILGKDKREENLKIIQKSIDKSRGETMNNVTRDQILDILHGDEE